MSGMSRGRKNWSKPSKEKMKKVAKSLKDNPVSTGAEDDGGSTQANLSALRAKNQTSTPGKARDIIKRRRA